MKRYLVLFISIFYFSHFSFAQVQRKRVEMSEINLPPEKFTTAQINEWTQQIIKENKINLPFELYNTAQWSNYVNFEHFVPLDADPFDGKDESLYYDYSWDGTRRGLPTAEVTEVGKFIMWDNRCNYSDFTEERCKSYIKTVILHEERHYLQWRKISKDVIENSFFKRLVNGKKVADTLDDFKFNPKLKKKFLEVWSDKGHYQCRETEVYSQQLLVGEMSKDKATWEGRIPLLEWYARKCRESKWSNDFKDHIELADKLWRQALEQGYTLEKIN